MTYSLSFYWLKYLSLALLLILLFPAMPVSAEQKKRVVRVYFLTGGPVDIFSHETARKVQEKVANYSQELGVTACYERHWFTECRSVSEKIAALGGRDKIVLIGHSWGGAGVVKVARYLNQQKLPVDLMITIDTTPVPGIVGSGRIPANVRLNYNFYQASDPIAHSCHKNLREKSGMEDGIHNVQVLVGRTYSPHLRVDDRIEPIVSAQIRLLMMDKLDRLRLPDRMDRSFISEATSQMETVRFR